MGKKGKRGDASSAKKSRKLASHSLHELLLFIIDKTHTIEDLLSIRGTSPQYIFTRAAELNLIFRLGDLYANYDIDINQITEMSREPFRIYKDTPLHAAVDGNSVNAVKWLLDKGADPNSVSESIINGEKDVLSSLWRAAEFGNSRIGYLLLNAGADPNTAKLSTGNTALYIAVQNNQREMISLLLSVDACPNAIGTGGIQRSLPPIICAISKGNLDVVAQLINAGAFLTHMHKMWTNPILEQMQNSGMTAAGEYSRKISQKEIRLLTELIDISKIEKLRNDETYQMACSQEKCGNYREALMLLQRVPLKLAKSQLMQDIERLITFLYGCKGSDGLTSIWKQYPPSKKEIRPFPLQFGAWVQVGRKVYTHGGLDFMNKQIFSRKTRLDELWELDIDKRVWRKLKTGGQTPGPRCGHAMFYYNNALYIWGGKFGLTMTSHGCLDSKLYRLELSEVGGMFTWNVVKAKGSLKPSPREEFASTLYRGKFYIDGGALRGSGSDIADDLWCFDLTSLRWTALPSSKTKRYHHGMFAARGKLFAFGGRMFEEDCVNAHQASHSIDTFESYDIESKKWMKVRAGGDKTYDVSEFCLLPLYGKNRDTEEPHSVMVWGGYSEHNMKLDRAKVYGEDFREFCTPYKKRLLRYDVDANVWTLLKPTAEILPKAESFGAELGCSEDGYTKLLFGGGYGFTDKSTTMNPDEFDPMSRAFMEKARIKTEEAGIDSSASLIPEASTSLYEVSILDTSAPNYSALRANFEGSGWAWKIFDLGEERPGINLESTAFSPTLHLVSDLTLQDFMENPCEKVNLDDEKTLLGVRVKVKGLQSKKELNGSIGRCGIFNDEKGRYQVFIPSYEKGGPFAFCAKPENLTLAEPVDDIRSMFQKGAIGERATFPTVIMPYMLPIDCEITTSPLEMIFNEGAIPNANEKNMTLISDTYHGPVSREAQSILRAIVGMQKGSVISFPLFPASMSNDVKKEMKVKFDILSKFYFEQKKKNEEAIKLYEDRLRNKSPHQNSYNWLKLTVSINGIIPSVERAIIVSPDISMQNLHHQVLCPCIGWVENYHAYAFRVIPKEAASIQGMSKNSNFGKAMREMSQACWIGPNKTSALDSIYQFLYIGCALANDKAITLRDIFEDCPKDQVYLQYVYDFGDFYSHSITLEKYDDEVPKDATVAYLLSGSNPCPPEDIGGVNRYGSVVSKLSGKVAHEDESLNLSENENFLSPSNERWWDLLNSEVRGKPNTMGLSNPMAFNLEYHREKLSEAIRKKQIKTMDARKTWTQWTNHGVNSEVHVPVLKEITDPKKICAVCGVSVALKLCAGCQGIAFCSREHQVQYWPQHKKDCKVAQKATKK